VQDPINVEVSKNILRAHPVIIKQLINRKSLCLLTKVTKQLSDTS